MADNEQQFGIKIAVAGAGDAAAAVSTVTASLEDASKEAKLTGEALETAGVEGEKGTNMLQGGGRGVLAGFKAVRVESMALSMITRGDFAGAMAIGTDAVKGLNAAMRANPVGLLVAGFAELAAVGLPMWFANSTAALEKTGKKGHEAAAGVKDAGDEAKKAAPELDDLSDSAKHAGEGAEAAKGFLKLLNDDLEETTKKAQAARQSLDALEGAKTALQLAQIDRQVAGGELSPAEGTLKKAEVRESNEVDKKRREAEGAGDELNTKELARAVVAEEAKASAERAAAATAEAEAADKAAQAASHKKEQIEERARRLAASGIEAPEAKAYTEKASEAADAEKAEAEEHAKDARRRATEAAERAVTLQGQKPKMDEEVRLAGQKKQAADLSLQAQEITSGTEVGKASGGVAKENAEKAAKEAAEAQAAAKKAADTKSGMIGEEKKQAEAALAELKAQQAGEEGDFAKQRETIKKIGELHLKISDLSDAEKAAKGQLGEAEKAQGAGQRSEAKAATKTQLGKVDAAEEKEKAEAAKEAERARKEAAKEKELEDDARRHGKLHISAATRHAAADAPGGKGGGKEDDVIGKLAAGNSHMEKLVPHLAKTAEVMGHVGGVLDKLGAAQEALKARVDRLDNQQK